MTREEYIASAKARALEGIKTGDPAKACRSMLSDLMKWDGEPILDPVTYVEKARAARQAIRSDPDRTR